MVSPTLGGLTALQLGGMTWMEQAGEELLVDVIMFVERAVKVRGQT